MNKNDLKLVIFTLVIVISSILLFKIFSSSGTKAEVYYENKLALTIDLKIKEKKEYIVDGFNGKVKIISENGKVKVDSENSPLHLCSKQGFISKSYETIVCLPNKIIIKIVADEKLDGVVK